MPVNRVQRVSSSTDVKFPPKRQNSMPLAYDESTDQLITMNELGQVTAVQTLNPYIASENILKYEYGTITNAEIKALRATPKTLVAAVAGGKVIEFVSLALFLDYGSNVLTESADNLAVRYTDGSGAIVSQTIEATNFIDAAADTMTIALAKIDPIAAKTGCDGQAIVLHNTGDGEYAGNAGADTIIRYKCIYRVHSAGW